MFNFFDRIVFFINVIAALVLLAAFAFPFLPPSKFPLTVLSLGVPLIILLNIAFVGYWLLRRKKRLLLSLILLIGATLYFNIIPSFSSSEITTDSNNRIKVMSYNVRLFNAYEKKDKFPDVKETMRKYIEEENPDVICIQEFYTKNPVDFSKYKYKFVHFKKKKDKLGYAIYSKYPIEKSGAFDFADSNNNTIYVDIVKDNQKIRIYNLHLQSHGVIPEVQFLQEESKEKLVRRLNQRFRKQERQIKEIINHKSKIDYPTLVVGDFNNTPYSYTYNQLQKGMKDAYIEAGNSLGGSFSFSGFPLRIDFILTSPFFEVTDFKVLKNTFSDHKAIVAEMAW